MDNDAWTLWDQCRHLSSGKIRKKIRDRKQLHFQFNSFLLWIHMPYMTSWSLKSSCTFGFGEQMNQITGFLDGEIIFIQNRCYVIILLQVAACMALMRRMRRIWEIIKEDYSSILYDNFQLFFIYWRFQDLQTWQHWQEKAPSCSMFIFQSENKNEAIDHMALNNIVTSKHNEWALWWGSSCLRTRRRVWRMSARSRRTSRRQRTGSASRLGTVAATSSRGWLCTTPCGSGSTTGGTSAVFLVWIILL